MITAYGWSDALARDFEPYAAEGLVPGRVIVQQRGGYRLITERGEVEARAAAQLMKEAGETEAPAAGDWVAAEIVGDEALIRRVLPRSTAFVRRASGPRGGAQVVAANADVAFLVTSMNADFSLRRLERYLATAHESGAEPVVVLTKADLSDRVEAHLEEARSVALDAPVLAVSARTGLGLDGLAVHLPPGRTAVLLGTSGAGKSTLVNALAGQERMDTGEIREDDARGRHTTTHRELVLLPGGGLILDTPGMRELGLWQSEAGLAVAFADIEALAAECRFRDCGHGSEPGCAVRAAIEQGRLDEARLLSHQKLQGELAFERRREDPRAEQANRKLWATKTKAARVHIRAKRRIEEE